MPQLSEAKRTIEEAINSSSMCIAVGECRVEYWGRAASKLPKGKRMLLLKGDKSFAIHQNRLLRPTNYMMDAAIKCELSGEELVIIASKLNPRETIKVFLESAEFVKSFEMEGKEKSDLRLFGSEKEISDALMNDMSCIEAGLKPLKREPPFRKGVIDIIAEDKEGKLVVVEVKRRKASFEAVTQLQRYMKQVGKMKNRETRGILVAPEIMDNALKLLQEYGLEYCKLDFEIGNPKVKIRGVEKHPTLGEYLGRVKA